MRNAGALGTASVVLSLVTACGGVSAPSSPAAGLSVVPSSGAELVSPTTTSDEPSDTRGPLNPETLAWLRTSEVERADVPVGFGLQLVRGDGSVAWSTDVTLDPDVPNFGSGFIDGPRKGVLAYGFPAADGTRVTVVRAETGIATEVMTAADAVLTGTIDPSAQWVYLAVQDASDVWLSRVPVGGGEPERLLELDGEALATNTSAAFDLMHWTPDGSRLLLQWCVMDRCSWDVLDVASGEWRELDAAGAGPLIDLSNEVGLARVAVCATGPCPMVLIDLGTGETRPFDPEANEARLVTTDTGETVAVYDTQGTGGPMRIVAVDLATGRQRVLYEPTDAGFGYGLARTGQDEWAPSGWIVAAPSGTNLGEAGGPALINVTDGTLVVLPMPD